MNHVHGEISSASEVLYKLLNKEKIDLDIATAIYTGMIHDTGVFQYSSTSPDTMRIAGDLMEKGVDFLILLTNPSIRRATFRIRSWGVFWQRALCFWMVNVSLAT